MKWLMKLPPVKRLARLLSPSGSTLAGYAADGITKSVNSSKDEAKAKIARYSSYAQETTRIANTLSKMLADGKIDPSETKALQELLTPLFEKALALV